MTPRERVEQRAIRCAQRYAADNGKAGDATTIGLVLAGMAVAARMRPETLALLRTGYDAEFPAEVAVQDGWARFIDGEAAS